MLIFSILKKYSRFGSRYGSSDGFCIIGGFTWSIKSINLECLGSISFALINDMSINLSGLYVRMTEHAFYNKYIRAILQLKGSECVTRTVESDRLRKEKQTEED